MSAIVALTAQNTIGVTSMQEVAAEFVEAQLEAVFSDIGVEAAKTGILFSREIVETVAAFLAEHPVQLVVDPVMISAAGAHLLQDDAVEALVTLLFPLATVVLRTSTRPRHSATSTRSRGVLAGSSMRSARLRCSSRVATATAPWTTFTSGKHVEIPVERHDVPATHGAGCTHSATLTALLARGKSLEDAARGASEAAADAVAHGLVDLGDGEGPVDVLHVADAQ